MKRERENSPSNRKNKPYNPNAEVSALRWGKRRHAIFLTMVAVGVFALVFLASATVLSPRRYNLEVGDIAPETIKATKDVEDRVRTEALIKQAVGAVDDIYSRDGKITDSVTSALTGFFDTVDELYKEVETLRAAWQSSLPPSNGDGGNVQRTFQLDNAFVEQAITRLDSNLTREDTLWLLTASRADIQALNEATTTTAQHALSQGILEDDFDLALQDSIRLLEQQGLGATANRAGTKLLTRFLKPNQFYDQAATQAARDKAASEITPYTYKNGETIVRDGERLSSAQIAVLDSLGLLAQKSVDIKMYLGIGLFIVLTLGIVIWYIMMFEKQLLKSPRRVLLLAAIIIAVAGMATAIGQIKPELTPVAFGSMVVALMLHSRLAIVVNLALALLAGLLSSGSNGIMSQTMLNITLIGIIGGTGGVLLLRRTQQRMTPFYAGLGVGVLNMLSALSIGLMSTGSLQQVLVKSLWGLAAGAIAGILVIGVLPVLESLFGIVTPMHLLELANPNQPLLQRLLLEAPGTYHHSIIVGNLAERAAAAVGANEMLARTGAYYHDVGKLKRPIFFAENQIGGENPHENITPELSTMIITAHTLDGLKLAQEHRLPPPVQDIIVQHHGTTPVAYFYIKARKQAEQPELVSIEDFRYSGPKPQSREAAIIMLADTVEAAVRASSDHSKNAVHALVHKLVRGKLEDGQLDECPLTVKELTVIEEAFCQVLSGTFHERIEYPSMESVQSSLPQASAGTDAYTAAQPANSNAQQG